MSNKVRNHSFQYIWPTVIKSGATRATLQYQLEALFLVYTTQKFVTIPPMLALTSQSLNKFVYYLPLSRGCYVKHAILFFDKTTVFTNKEVRLGPTENKFIPREYQRLLVQSTTKKVSPRLFSKLNLIFLLQSTNNVLLTYDKYRSASGKKIISINYFLMLIRQIHTINKNVRCNMFNIKLAQYINSKSISIQYKSKMVKNLTIHTLCKISKYTLKKYRQHYFFSRWIRSKKRRRQKSIGFFMKIDKNLLQKFFKRRLKSNLTKPVYTNYTARTKVFTNIRCYVLYKQKNVGF